LFCAGDPEPVRSVAFVLNVEIWPGLPGRLVQVAVAVFVMDCPAVTFAFTRAWKRSTDVAPCANVAHVAVRGPASLSVAAGPETFWSVPGTSVRPAGTASDSAASNASAPFVTVGFATVSVNVTTSPA
jgi:hypothetical protein